MTVLDVTLRVVTAEALDALEVGELIDERLDMDGVEVRITRLVEKFDPSASFNRGPGRPRDERIKAAVWLTQFLDTLGAVPAGDVQAEAVRAGISIKTLRRAAREVGVICDPPGGGRSCNWKLSDDQQLKLEVKDA